jgi:hypothetical protein
VSGIRTHALRIPTHALEKRRMDGAQSYLAELAEKL